MIKPTKLILLGVATLALILLPRRSSTKDKNKDKHNDSTKTNP